MPDILGMKLNAGLKKLKSRGLEDITIRVTTPPHESDREPCADSRIVKIINKEGGNIEIIVCNYPNL